MARHLGLIGFSFVAMALLVVATQAATDYTVGDSFGWNIPPNDSFYSDWASSRNFVVGDTLYFNWTGKHDWVEVSKDDYDNCNTNQGIVFENSIQFKLTGTGPRYFICTVSNHCSRGQKLSIEVESSSSAGPSAQPPPPDSSAPTLSFGVLSAFLSSVAVYFFSI